MGQKVNPHGLRVGIERDWESQWYEEKEYFCFQNQSKDWNLTVPKRLILPPQKLLA